MRTALVILGLATPALAGPPPVCPAPVTAAATKAVPRATVRACKAIREHGKDLFAVTLIRAGGGTVDVDVAPDGAILQIEEAIALDALPAAVTQAFAAKYPRGTLIAAEKHTARNHVSYELAFGSDGRRKEATFAADGKFLEEE